KDNLKHADTKEKVALPKPEGSAYQFTFIYNGFVLAFCVAVLYYLLLLLCLYISLVYYCTNIQLFCQEYLFAVLIVVVGCSDRALVTTLYCNPPGCAFKSGLYQCASGICFSTES
ncbi:hypothetical protein LSH36_15g17056, partial [Paralvinella palmiformis]